jgi:glycosyltransferase involved in cell wall biosynthesis
VVIPLYQEAENVAPLLEELVPVLRSLGSPYEIVMIDDGSTDGTAARLDEQRAMEPRLRVLTFARNHGQSAALDAGFQAARGEIVITMDGDLQCDPAAIPTLLDHLETHDCVCGQRQQRRDTLVRRLSSRIANGIRNLLTGDRVRDTGSPLKVIRAEHLRRIPRFNGMHRFLPTLLRRIGGARVIEVPVPHRPRQAGRSKYGIGNRALRGLRDCFGVRWLRARGLRYHDDLRAEDEDTHPVC